MWENAKANCTAFARLAVVLLSILMRGLDWVQEKIQSLPLNSSYKLNAQREECRKIYFQHDVFAKKECENYDIFTDRLLLERFLIRKTGPGNATAGFFLVRFNSREQLSRLMIDAQSHVILILFLHSTLPRAECVYLRCWNSTVIQIF